MEILMFVPAIMLIVAAFMSNRMLASQSSQKLPEELEIIKISGIFCSLIAVVMILIAIAIMQIT